MEYNKFPEAEDNGKVISIGKPRQLRRGERVEYELANLKPNPLDKVNNSLAVPFMRGIPNKDVVYIPVPKKHQGELGEGVYIDIAYVIGRDSAGEPRLGDVIFHRAKAGVITCVGGKANDQSLFEYLETCNWNESNPNRDTSYEAVFKVINNKAKAEAERKKRKLQREAGEKAENLKLNEIKKVAVALGRFEDADEEILRDVIEQYAHNSPEKFLNTLENTDLIIQEDGYNAMKAGLIKVDMQKRMINDANGKVLKSWTPEKDVNWTEKFVEFVKSEEGEEFYKSIKDDLKGRELKAKK